MVHECDCGARYSNLDVLMACQNANHGRQRTPGGSLIRAIDLTMNDCFESAAKACEALADDWWGSRRRPYMECAEKIRTFKKQVEDK
jgi:hypothetical protein